jgi:cellulose synthase/poly-beta-1,6-N-acetylglucosamine synthase-like glycosyltransferase
MAELHRLVVDVFTDTDWVVLGYFVVLNTSYLLLLALAAGELARYVRWRPVSEADETVVGVFTPPVSVLVPAYNEEQGIVESVGAMLSLRYPQLEVVVVVDGATDGTLEALREAYDLAQVPLDWREEVSVRVAPHQLWVSQGDAPLTVAVKANSGRADTLNVAVNLARYPLVCMVDADSILDADALVRVTQPFVDDPDRVVATGGVIRAVNGCTVRHGRVVDVRMPRGWIARAQVVEYLRAFLMGRTGWSRLGSLLVISGAFGLFRRDILVTVGGFDASCIGEDAELVVRLHRHFRDRREPYRMAFVAEPVSWTEVPATATILGRQRRRWSRGLAEIVARHRRMLFNPRYGRIGLLALPYYVAFELVAPIIELVGIPLVILGLALRLVDVPAAALLLAVAVGYGLSLSLASLLLEELTFHRNSRWRDLGVAVLVAAVENLGYRQVLAFYQLRGLWDAVRGGAYVWGEMPRAGFRSAP